MGRSRKGRVSARRWREEVRGGSNYLKLPEGLTLFSGKPGTYRLDFMSFVAGKGNPRAEPGEMYFERTFFVHQGIGPNQDWHLCLARTLKKPCPVCEHRAKMSADPTADEKLIKSLAPKERQLWLLKDLMNDPDAVQIWEVSYHLFGKQLKDKINNSDEEDGYDYFADPSDGLTMRLALQQSDKGKWSDVGDIEFRARKRQYDPEVTEEMPCLDDLIVGMSYDKLKALFLQTEEEDDDEPEEKSKRRAKKDDDEPEEKPRRKTKARPDVSAGDEVWYHKKKCEVVHVSGDGTSLVLEDEDEVIHKAVAPEDLEVPSKKSKADELYEDDDESKKKSSKRSKPEKAADDDDEPWDDDEPEEKPSKKSKPKKDDDEEKSSESKKKAVDGDDDWDNW